MTGINTFPKDSAFKQIEDQRAQEQVDAETPHETLKGDEDEKQIRRAVARFSNRFVLANRGDLEAAYGQLDLLHTVAAQTTGGKITVEEEELEHLRDLVYRNLP